MKRINTILIFVLTVILVFPIIIFAQNKIIDKAEREKREVQEFTDSFLKQLEKTKDLAKVPKSFFATEFLNRSLFVDVDEELEKKTPSPLRFKLNTLSFNLTYLGITHFLGRMTKAEFIKAEEKSNKTVSKPRQEEDGFTEFFFPTKLLKLYRSRKLLSKLNDSEFKIKTTQELNQLIDELETVTNAQRLYLQKHNLPRKSSYFNKEMRNVKNITYWEKDDIYSRIDSNGLKYIEVGGYIIRLRITKVDGKPKILDIFLLAD